ncbi:MAG: peptidylprolyl isomerase [Robiginitomaculum sp.]|nr:MAG: peptidylprolyl isomerase [Robiginitomaculum sp.]
MVKFILSIACVGLLAACGQKDQPDQAETPGEKPVVLSAIELSGNVYREVNAKKDGVRVTDTGLQILELAEGDARGPRPMPGQVVCVHYRGTSVLGVEFDSSYSRDLPTAFPSNGVIAGWVEALGMMRAGDKWNLVIAPELAYGTRGTPGGPIAPNETLVFDVELLKILDITRDEYMATYRVDPTLDCSKHGE